MRSGGAITLMDYLVRLAIDIDSLSDFVRDPRGAARRAGLAQKDVDVLLSGDQNRIYVTLRKGKQVDGDQ